MSEDEIIYYHVSDGIEVERKGRTPAALAIDTKKCKRERMWKLFACCAILIVGCSSNHQYKVVGTRSYFDKEQDGGNGGQMIIYTLAHDGETLKARCQAWDTKNNCYELEIGRSYDLERQRGVPDMLCLYDETQKKNKDMLTRKAKVVLVVEEEKIGQ